MYITSAEFKKNPGKYLTYSSGEDIIITINKNPVAILSSADKKYRVHRLLSEECAD